MSSSNIVTFFEEQHIDIVKEIGFSHWYLKIARPSKDFLQLAFNDDFKTGTFDLKWNWLDEFKDSSYRISENSGVEIHSANGRGLTGLNISTPRFMMEISGDFAIEVCIAPVSDAQPQIGGLLLWKDKNHYVRFEKGYHEEDTIIMYGYINEEWVIAGRGLLPASDNDETYLRLERSGDVFSSYVNTDGINWLTCGKMTLPMEDPIQVGIHAIGMIDRTIYCGEYKEGTATLFRNFRIWTRE